ncbi:hypothetical protein VFPPC_05734 [Pochonia chlamydosporia 170]|uniref:Uncharacterized protein n=1 Tax=Pochonia chlamydosporia 170 TaxID=1380566 RepID=A0A179FFS9_METCM|nr:hypothetical protein VFPPC_05734 [Pochonia chlamydosporia 170]OAQ64465.1 hypothetical protein VFPPC_05734 [Pochonia chlamydosporia 170]
MTLKHLPVAIAATLAYLQGVQAGNPFAFCTDNKCEKCPVSVTSDGTGYPNCVVYESKDIFPGQGFTGSKGGGYAPFINIEEPDHGCSVIIKSPADTDIQGCGYPIGSFKHAACAAVNLDKTFMVQFCCGSGDCEAAGASKRSSRFNRAYLEGRAGGGGGVYLQDQDGNVIKPLKEGPPINARSLLKGEHKRQAIKPPHLQTRKDKGRCDGDWKPDSDATDKYTKPSEKTTVVANDVDGGSGGTTITITAERSQSWTNGTNFDFGIADILSLGASISNSFTEEKSDTRSKAFSVPAGQSGDVGFTAFLVCTKGSGTCDGKKVSGEICMPKVTEDDGLDGITAVIAHS